MQRHLLIDGDIVVYRFACRSETAVDWDGDGQVCYNGDVNGARAEAMGFIGSLMEKLKADSYTLAFGDPSHKYFRHDLWPDYKLFRSQGRPPVHRTEVEDILRTEFNAKWKPGLEADDVMGIAATHPEFEPGAEKVIVTIDKDLDTVPGPHFNYYKDERIRDVSVEEADRTFMYFTLVGDQAEGFKGCPSIGPKRAGKLLNEAEEAWVQVEAHILKADSILEVYWRYVRDVFQLKGKSIDDAILQARLARILRAEDYDFVNKKPILWQPPH